MSISLNLQALEVSFFVQLMCTRRKVFVSSSPSRGREVVSSKFCFYVVKDFCLSFKVEPPKQ